MQGVANHSLLILKQLPASLTMTEVSEVRLGQTRSVVRQNLADWAADGGDVTVEFEDAAGNKTEVAGATVRHDPASGSFEVAAGAGRTPAQVDCEYMVADWLAVGGSGGPHFDALVTNPPFAQSGKQNRRYFIDELVLNAHKVRNPRWLGSFDAQGSHFTTI